jgi:hypothetical protein
MTTATASSPADILNWQAEQIRDGKYEPIGLGVRMEFGDHGARGPEVMPRIAQTKDRSTLLLLDPVVRRDGKVGLPDIPDPTWIPPLHIPSKAEQEGKETYTPPSAPMLRQELADRARGQVKGTRFLVFGPVSQILIRPEGIPEGWIAYCGSSSAAPGVDGTQMEMLIDQDNGQAFFFGGRFQIVRAG